MCLCVSGQDFQWHGPLQTAFRKKCISKTDSALSKDSLNISGAGAGDTHNHAICRGDGGKGGCSRRRRLRRRLGIIRPVVCLLITNIITDKQICRNGEKSWTVLSKCPNTSRVLGPGDTGSNSYCLRKKFTDFKIRRKIHMWGCCFCGRNQTKGILFVEGDGVSEWASKWASERVRRRNQR